MSEYEMVRYHDGQRYMTAMKYEGRKYMHVVTIEDNGVVKKSVPIEEAKWYCQPLLKGSEPYPLVRGIEKLRSIGRRVGITQGAKELLDDAANALALTVAEAKAAA